MPIAFIILLIVLLFIMGRQLIPFAPAIWLIMTIGAIATLVTFQISPLAAWQAINWQVIGYLIGVFIIGRALEDSGLLYRLSERVFAHAHTGQSFLLSLIFIFGLLSTILMNDTVAIIATPLLIMIARKNKIDAKPLLLALAFSVSLGSTLSPIGNPQNLLIASESGMPQAFKSFLQYLTLPTLISLGICYGLFHLRYRNTLIKTRITTVVEQAHYRPLSLLCQCSLLLMILLIAAKITLEITSGYHLNFSLIGIISCLPIVLFSHRRWKIVRDIDWHTIIFFISMFILMQSVWDNGVIQHTLQTHQFNITHIPTILIIGAVVSQLISNVPLVALYLPLLIHHHANVPHFLALAAGSTIAGNFLIMGAASNVIIVQNAEKRGAKAFGLRDFILLGIPLGLLSLIIFGCFLMS